MSLLLNIDQLINKGIVEKSSLSTVISEKKRCMTG